MDNVEIINNLSHIGIEKRKRKIFLTHTSRNFEDYLSAIKNRNNGYFKRIPNFIITRDGKIVNLLNPECYSMFFSEENLNKKSIIISLENLGWLEKKLLTNQYINWIGDIYNGEVVKKRWRNQNLWQPYTEIQYNKTVELCKMLAKDFSIDKKCIGHNTKVNDFEKYCGILTRSNISNNFTDVSPAFNFSEFIKQLDDE